MYPSLPDVPYSQLTYRHALLSTEFAGDRARRKDRGHARVLRPLLRFTRHGA